MTETPLRPADPLVAAVRAIEVSRRRIAVVADESGRLLGTLTDGDVRRCLLASGGLDTPVSAAMNPHPIAAEEGSPDQYLLDLMRRGNVMAVPIVDDQGRFRRLVHLTDLAPDASASGSGSDFALAVIMAGGEGARLRPLTATIPKPMVDMGGMPLLQRQVERLARAGLTRVYVAVNYLGHVIEDHFGDGGRFGIEIRYLRESERQGTAGALGMLPEVPGGPIVVMNGDIVTTFHFGDLSAYHRSHGAAITVAAVDYRIDIPYGVLSAEGPYLSALVEKPSQRFLCNAGVYAVSPEALRLLPSRRCDMTDLVAACLAANQPVAVFPVHEFWSDIGTSDDLERARSLFAGGPER